MLENKVIKTIEGYNLIEKNDFILLGVSGGPDSMVMLHLFHKLSKKLNYSIACAHLNHKIRNGSEKDLLLVTKICKKYNIPIFTGEAHVAKIAKHRKLSIEDAGRFARYTFFLKTAKQIGSNKIFMAHQADDQIETFLMRLLRGSGNQGLKGIPMVREVDFSVLNPFLDKKVKVKIVRPLLNIWRSEIEEYVRINKIPFNTDITNKDNKFLRNKIRNKLIPNLIKEYNPNLKETLLRTLNLIGEDEEYLKNFSRLLTEEFIKEENNTLIITISKLNNQPLAMKRRILRESILNFSGTLNNINFDHVEDIINKISSSGSFELHLPNSLYVYRNRNQLIFKQTPNELTKIDNYHYLINIPGETKIPEIDKTIIASIEKTNTPLSHIETKPNKICLDFDKLSTELVVRKRKNGDRFHPLGLNGTKKLKKYLIDKKVSQEEKEKIPVVVSEKNEIAWLAGHQINDKFKITKDTKNILKLEIKTKL